MHINPQSFQKQLLANRALFEDIVRRKFIFCQAAEIYGGVAGLFDYGPVGAGIKNNLIQAWKNHFIVEEELLEISCTTLTPQVVLKHSGHEERFIDWMIKDQETGESFRADHLIEDFIEKELQKANTEKESRAELDSLRRQLANFQSSTQFDEVIQKYGLKNPSTQKGSFGKVYAFNLMFDCRIGPLGDQKAYLRPETAQSIFCNFKKLLDFNNGKLPFGAAIVGSAYRNEIAPRNGLLRVREFEMAEIEFFVDPSVSKHPKIENVKEVVLPLFSREFQQAGDTKTMTVGEALDTGLLKNQVLAYFMARTFLFATEIGLKGPCLRFRQHQAGEMAHYASDCWDLEVLTSYGWIECVGLADRAAYDLTAHMKGSGEKLVASRLLREPISRHIRCFVADKSKVAKVYKNETLQVIDAIERVSTETFNELEKELELNGHFMIGEYKIEKDMIKEIKEENKLIQEEKFVPSVIEPSFGIGRIIYALLEHNFSVRSDTKRTFFAFNSLLAPYKVVFLPLLNKEPLTLRVEQLVKAFRQAGVNCRVDSGSSAIGRRYARTDEMGIPLAITVDFTTLEDDTATVREICTMEQIRVPCSDLLVLAESMIRGQKKWADFLERYPKHSASEND